MNYEIFNKSSESMSEVKSGSIDIVFFSPPYNIKTFYNDFDDDLEPKEYLDLMNLVIWESVRVLKNEGRLIIEVADSVYMNGKYIRLAGIFQKFAVVDGKMFLENRHINFVESEEFFELSGHGFGKNYETSGEAHSNCHQILVFSKSKKEFGKGEILYINYKNSTEHPCAEPKEMIDFLFKKYFKPGMKVVDPFMGTANLGARVVREGGFFYGYELVKSFYDTSKKKLDQA